ncbi:MAG: T9SS type A sorting domain-containing protein [Ferruginibacter sp.]
MLSLLCTQYNSFSLPITLEFTALFDAGKKAVLIKWQHKPAAIQKYIVQRSLDKNSWADIAVQGIKENTDPRSFYFEDKEPQAGENYYRLKSVSNNGKIEYSLPVMIIIASPKEGWIMYPVPVTDLLTLDYRGTEPIKGVINVFIIQSSGRVLTKLRHSSLNKVIQIPVSNLGKGVYDIRIVIGGDIVWNQRFIK